MTGGWKGGALILAVVAASAYMARGYAPTYDGPPSAASTQTIAWPAAATVNYVTWTGNNGASNLTGGGANAAVAAAFASTNAVTGLNFTNTGTFSSSSGTATANSVNEVTFANTAGNIAAVGGALAIAAFYYSIPSFQIVESDLVFNPATLYTTNGTSGQYDVQSVATHEAGHACGLDHCPLCHSTMFPFGFTDSTAARTLEADDRAGLRQLYPTAPLSFALGQGAVSGAVLLSGGGTVAGAHVFLTDAVRGTLGPSAVSRANGQFTISGVPVGIWRLSVEPIDGPMTTGSLSASGWSGVSFNTTFRSMTLGGSTPTVLTVRHGFTTAAGNVTVAGPAPTLNPVAAIPMPTATGGFGFQFGKPAVLTAPYTAWLVILGAGFNSLPDGAFSFDSPFVSITGPSTQSGTAGVGYKIFPVSVAAATPPGGYAIVVSNGGESAYGAGLVEVSPAVSPPAFVQHFGESCPSVGAITFATTGGAPSINNGSFSMRATGTTAGRTVHFFLAGLPDAFLSTGNYTPSTQCRIYIDLNSLIVPFPGLQVTAIGNVTIQPLPVPNMPGLSGIDVYAQVAEMNTSTGALKVSQAALLAIR